MTYEILSTKKKFTYEGIEMRIVVRKEPYMNSGRFLEMTRVIAPNNLNLPLTIPKNSTLKTIVSMSIEALDGFKKRGADVVKELTKTV